MSSHYDFFSLRTNGICTLFFLQPLFCELLELALFGFPLGIHRRRDGLAQLLARIRITIHVEERLGEEPVRRDAVRVVGERFAEVLLGLLLAATEEARHFEVPPPERAVG